MLRRIISRSTFGVYMQRIGKITFSIALKSKYLETLYLETKNTKRNDSQFNYPGGKIIRSNLAGLSRNESRILKENNYYINSGLFQRRKTSKNKMIYKVKFPILRDVLGFYR